MAGGGVPAERGKGGRVPDPDRRPRVSVGRQPGSCSGAFRSSQTALAAFAVADPACLQQMLRVTLSLGGLVSHSPVSRLSGDSRFERIRCLGRGGMGLVYEADDRLRGERVAVKVLRKTDPDMLLRFKKEFRSLARLSHPNLVQLYELVKDGDEWLFSIGATRRRWFSEMG